MATAVLGDLCGGDVGGLEGRRPQQSPLDCKLTFKHETASVNGYAESNIQNLEEY